MAEILRREEWSWLSSWHDEHDCDAGPQTVGESTGENRICKRDATIAALSEAWRAERRARLKAQRAVPLGPGLANCRPSMKQADAASEKLVEAGWLDDDGGDDARD